MTTTESSLKTHDLGLRMPSENDESYLAVLVLGPANTVDACLSDTKARLQQFAATSKGKPSIIAFVLDEEQGDPTSLDDLQHFMRLQTALFESDIPCPALPVPGVSLLLTTLDAYLREIKSPPPKLDPTPPISACLLLPYATASAPMKPLSEHNSNVVSDTFSSLRALEEATRTQQGQAQLCNLVGRITAEDIVDFWADEWIV